jgi:3-methylcrotonyl-CoA carboxylase alpha subunit
MAALAVVACSRGWARAGTETRIDTGYREGDAITPYYDPLIAKLIVHAENRDAARELMAKSLAIAEIAGLKTNLSFLRRAVAHPKFASAEVHTRFVEGAQELVELILSFGPAARQPPMSSGR